MPEKCCRLKAGSRIVVRHKRSNDALRLDGTRQVVFQHVVTGEPIPDKHMLVLSPFTNETIWGDEWEIDDA